VDEQHAPPSHYWRSITLMKSSYSATWKLYLIAVSGDFNGGAGAVVDAVGVASCRCDQLGAVSHADPVGVDHHKEVVDTVHHDIGLVGRSLLGVLFNKAGVAGWGRHLQGKPTARGLDTVRHVG